MLSFFKSSIGKKYIVAVTGFLLFGFVVAHMLGNLQIFLGQEALNSYAEHLKELPALLWPARILLLAALIAHVGVAITLARQNRAARPIGYAYQNTVKASYASRTMVASGLIIFLFVIYHLLHFTFCVAHPDYCGRLDPKGRQDVYSMVVLSFQNIGISGVYILAMAALCNHLSHGLASMFQSTGLRSRATDAAIKKFAATFSLLIFIGNSAIPVSVLLGWIKLPGGL